ncbi:GGDEF domain-containing protein [Metasolibacillus meyeri]|uniref:GGDEF domain-containing protein n=1 Tax=Metasolibacillus meyeri TaxID=1071052 RepID=A0AAW9NVK3_9BACL|nr:GGDEF domain-containing protein [Metasolibacillus meyeri]MEC1178328.1 GGDEF domain-containing protein [Metasolibacillus meyeri]
MSLLLLDIKTVITLLAIGNICVFILISAYSYQYKNRTIWTFVLGKLLQIIAFIIMLLREILPFTLSIFLSNTLLLIGTMIECIALLILLKSLTANVRKAIIIVTLIGLFSFYSAILFYNFENVRIAIVSITIILLVAFPVRAFYRNCKTSILQCIMLILYSAIALSLLLRTYNALVISTDVTLFAENEYQTLAFLTRFIEMLVGSIGFILLVKEQTDVELTRMAMIDELTNIYNRRAFIQRADALIAIELKKKSPLSFIIFDIDRFKGINDTYGHDVGDYILKEIAKVISNVLPKGAIFGRYGGDEFVVLVPNCNSAKAIQLAETLRVTVLQHPFQHISTACTLSLGIATTEATSTISLDRLYTNADKALYQSKENGRNQVHAIRL